MEPVYLNDLCAISNSARIASGIKIHRWPKNESFDERSKSLTIEFVSAFEAAFFSTHMPEKIEMFDAFGRIRRSINTKSIRLIETHNTINVYELDHWSETNII